MHSLGIVQWNSTRRDQSENPGGVSGSGPVMQGEERGANSHMTVGGKGGRGPATLGPSGPPL